MRLMSFALTTEQVRRQEKTVTRRLGWRDAKPGDIVQPIVKGQGLKKGERVEKIDGPIRIISARRESLAQMVDRSKAAYGRDEVAKEGFPDMTPAAFVNMFCQHNGCTVLTVVTRIEFEYLPAGDQR